MSERELMPAGLYAGRMIDVQMGASEKGTPQMSIKWEIAHQLSDDGETWEKLGRPFNRVSPLYFSEKARDFSFKKLLAIGYNGDMRDVKVEDFGEDCRKSIVLVCRHKENNANPPKMTEQ